MNNLLKQFYNEFVWPNRVGYYHVSEGLQFEKILKNIENSNVYYVQ